MHGAPSCQVVAGLGDQELGPMGVASSHSGHWFESSATSASASFAFIAACMAAWLRARYGALDSQKAKRDLVERAQGKAGPQVRCRAAFALRSANMCRS